MRVAYLVSRFPTVSETFVLRELDAVAAEPGIELELRSLFPAGGEGAIHPAARPWTARLRRPGALAGLRATAWWARRRPGALARAWVQVMAAYARRPAKLARAVATLPLAAAHARELRAARVDHVHAHFATYPALAAWLAHRLAGIPYSFTAHAHDLFVHQSMLARKAEEARFVVAISEFNRAFLRAHGAVRVPIHVIRCGVHPAGYPDAARELPAGGPVRVICVAGLRESKGQDVLLRALAGADARLELDLVGDGERRGALEALARELGVQGRVRFHGSRSEPEVVELLAGAHVFVLPSVVAADGDMEGVPVALMEALASRLPTVSTRLSGIPELVRDGETGFLVEPGDAAGLRAALAAVLADPAEAARRAAAGRALVEREFDVRASARALARLFAAAGS